MDSRTSDKRKIVTSISRFKWVALILVLGAVLVIFRSQIGPIIQSGLTKAPQPTPPVVVNPPYRPLETVAYCVDGPPNYQPAIATQANIAVASAVDSLVTANQGGVHLIVTYIDSSSFEHNALIITVPAVSAAPTPPPYPNLSDPYKQAQALKAYKKELPVWQAAYDAWQKNLARVQSHVRQETDGLRKLKPRFDNTGSSVWGCLFTAARNFQGVTGKKVLLIASTLIQNTDDPVPNGFTLSGVTVEIIFHNCITTASACAGNDANWRGIFKRYGATSVSFSTVQQSETSSVSF